MAKLDSLTNEQKSPVLADRFHIIHQITGVWYSYWISLETIKDFISSYIFGNKITTLTFTEAGNQDYTAVQYENIEYVVFKYTLSTDTISIGTPANSTLYVDSLSEQLNVINKYNYSSNANSRKLRVTVSAACEVKIKSIINL